MIKVGYYSSTRKKKEKKEKKEKKRKEKEKKEKKIRFRVKLISSINSIKNRPA